MHHLLRWTGIVLVVLVLGGAPSTVADGGVPCPATPVVATSWVYGSSEPVILIGSDDLTAHLRVDRLPTDRYGAVTVASDSDDPFAFSLTTPLGDARPIFATESPGSFTGALLLDQTGTFTLTVEATGSWAIIIR